ncbi:hypothetical protein MNBD_GAMMA22-69 [hydrothermal vent metagenome]|uniref:Uncharacterized protein n=1 Tax=hydrothermal vent metagenome TaxID=652676 RepID=A0A3B1AK42_9ZZZZ
MSVFYFVTFVTNELQILKKLFETNDDTIIVPSLSGSLNALSTLISPVKQHESTSTLMLVTVLMHL